jgi:hypothetical protein
MNNDPRLMGMGMGIGGLVLGIRDKVEFWGRLY